VLLNFECSVVVLVIINIDTHYCRLGVLML